MISNLKPKYFNTYKILNKYKFKNLNFKIEKYLKIIVFRLY